MPKQNHDIGKQKRRPFNIETAIDTDYLAQELVDRGLATNRILDRPMTDPMKATEVR